MEVRESPNGTVDEVIRRMGMAEGQVKGTMRRMKLRLGTKRRPGPPPADVAQASRLRGHGLRWREVQKEMGLDEAALQSIRTRVNRYLRGQSYRQDDNPKAMAAE